MTRAHALRFITRPLNPLGDPAGPLYDISTIFYLTDQPDPRPENAAVGLVVHLALSAGFGALRELRRGASGLASEALDDSLGDARVRLGRQVHQALEGAPQRA
jgi:hypothetical protein